MNAADVKTVRKLGMLRSTGKNGRKRNVYGHFDAELANDSDTLDGGKGGHAYGRTKKAARNEIWRRVA